MPQPEYLWLMKGANEETSQFCRNSAEAVHQKLAFQVPQCKQAFLVSPHLRSRALGEDDSHVVIGK